MITEQNRINAEKALAKLLGCTYYPPDESRVGLGVRGSWSNGKKGKDFAYVDELPKWARDWSACGPLIIEHQLIVDCDDITEAGCVEVQWRDRNGMLDPVNAYYADHPSKESALMFAVVKAVIKKLTGAYHD